MRVRMLNRPGTDQPVPEVKEITVFPALLPEESVSGYLLRTITLNNAALVNGQRQLLGLRSTSATLALPGNLDFFATQAPQVFISADHLARHHTVEPLFRWTLPVCDFRKLRDWERSGGANPFSVALKSNFTGQSYPRHCMACAADDERRFGVAYWRRTAQLAFVAICPIHGESFVRGCGVCGPEDLMSSPFPLPAPRCVCGRLHQPVVSDDLEVHRSLLLRIARIAQELLLAEEPNAVCEAVPKAYLSAARDKGFVANRGVSALNIAKVLGATGGIEAFSALQLIVDKRAAYIRRIFRGQLPHSVGMQMLLIDLLFGSAANFVSACRVASERPESEPSVALDAPARLHRWRVLLESVLASNPGLTRSHLNRTKSSLIANLRKHDRAWLDATLPARYAKGPKVPHSIDPVTRAQQKDQTIAAHIRKHRADLLVRPGRPLRLTVSRLLGGNRSAVTAYHGDSFGPRAAQALADCTETIEQYGARCVRWALQHPETFGSMRSQMLYIAYYGRISQGQARQMVERYRAGPGAL